MTSGTTCSRNALVGETEGWGQVNPETREHRHRFLPLHGPVGREAPPPLVLLVRGDELIVCGVTSRLSGRGDAVPFTVDDMAEGRLPKRSEVRPLKLFTVHRSLVRTVVGRVKGETLDRVVGLWIAAVAQRERSTTIADPSA